MLASATTSAPVERPLTTRAATLAALLLAASGLAAGGCSSPSSPAFDLTAPAGGVRNGGLPGGQLVVAEPKSIAPFESERLVARDAAGSLSYLPGVQWADRLPSLFQARLIQTFENTSRLKAVGRPGEGLTAEYQLNTEIRSFGLDAATREAVVEVTVKLVAVTSGKVVRGQTFRARTPVPSVDGPTVAQALDRSFSRVLVDIVRWTGRG